MKAGVVAAALGAMASGAAAAHRRHVHEALFKKSMNTTGSICVPGCTTIWRTITGEPTFVPISTQMTTTTSSSSQPPPPPPPPPSSTQTPQSPATTEIVPASTALCNKPVNGTETDYVKHCHLTSQDLSKTSSAPAPTSSNVSTTSQAPTSQISTTSQLSTTTTSQTPPPPAKSSDAAKAQAVQAPDLPSPAKNPEDAKDKPIIQVPGLSFPAKIPEVTKDKPIVKIPGLSSPDKTPETDNAKHTPQGPDQSSAGSKGLTSNNDHFGITYTPYDATTGNCKTAEEVDMDIKAIKDGGFVTVRLYSTDCFTLEHVGEACKKYGLGIILGVFVKASGCDINTPEIKEQVDKLVAWDKWDLVRLLVVGNEAIMNNYCTPQQLRTLVTTVKSKCSGKYKGPVTISETLNIWQRKDVSSAICGVVDVTGANIHAFFNSAIAPSMAGLFVKGQLDILKTICPGNEVINLECGYPHGGVANGLAIPGISEQALAIKSIRELVGFQTVFFSFQSDIWKGDKTACKCEDKFGLGAIFGMKVGM